MNVIVTIFRYHGIGIKIVHRRQNGLQVKQSRTSFYEYNTRLSVEIICRKYVEISKYRSMPCMAVF